MLLRATLVAAAIATATVGWTSPANSEVGGCYLAAFGDRVPDPTAAPAPPPGAHALPAQVMRSWGSHSAIRREPACRTGPDGPKPEQRGTHTYDLADYGLTPEQVR